MSRVLLLGLLIYALMLLGLATFQGELLALALPLTLYLGAGLLFGPDSLQLEAERNISPQRITQDKPINVRLRVTNRGGHQEIAFIQDPLPEGLEIVAGANSLLTELPPGGELELNYTLIGLRGLYQFNALQAHASDLLGVHQHRQTVPSPGEAFVLPNTPRLKRVSLRSWGTRIYTGSIPARRGGPGVEFFGVRNYQPGDPLRWINWKASARQGDNYFSNEFEQERITDVHLVLDARKRSNPASPQGTREGNTQGSLFESSVQACAALAQALLRDGNRVGLLIYGRFLDWTYPGYGKVQQERILRALARARAGESMVFDRLEYLPTRLLPIRSQMILISPLVNDDLPILIRLRARGYRLMLVSPDPVRFVARNLRRSADENLGLRVATLERSLMLKRLVHAGLQVIDWDVSSTLEQAVLLLLKRPAPPLLVPQPWPSI